MGDPHQAASVGWKGDTDLCCLHVGNQSGQPVPPEVIPDPKIDLNFPDLTLQPWYQGPGNSIAVEFADSLIKNGYWDIPDTGTPDPDDTTQLNWEDDGLKMLVNEKIGNNKNQSNFSPYFLWDIGVKPGKTSLKSEVVYYNRAPRIISKSQRLCRHEKAAKEAAEKENAISSIGKISQTLGGPPQDSCNHCYVTRALEITKEVECQVLEAPPSLVPF